MQTGMSLQDFAAEVERQNTLKRDFVVPSELITIHPELRLTFPGPDKPLSFGIGDVAHEQLRDHTKIPAVYYHRLQTLAPALLAINLNHWMTLDHQPRLVRTLSDQARAFLSDRYRALDNYDLAQQVLPVLAEAAVTVRSTQITERRLYIKAVNERLTRDIAVDDPVQAGVVISNSEVGSGALKIEPLLYRLKCLNGMIAADASLRKYHLGRADTNGASDGFYEVLRTETQIQTDRALWMQVQDLTRAALSEALFLQIVERAQAAAGQFITGRIEKAVAVTQRRFSLTEDEGGDILRHLIGGQDLSQWGLANAVTRAAHDAPSYDRSTVLERIGGQVIELAPTDWQTIAEAA